MYGEVRLTGGDSRAGHPPQPVATLVALRLHAEPSAMDNTVMPTVGQRVISPSLAKHNPSRTRRPDGSGWGPGSGSRLL